MITARRLLIGFAFLIVLCGIGGLGIFAYRQRLGAALTDPTPVVIITNTPIVLIPPPSLAPPTPTVTPIVPQSPPTQTPIPALSTSCGENTAWNVLVLGTDLSELDSLNGSDLTRVMRVDFQNQRVTVYAFPRDLWVDTYGIGFTYPSVNAIRLGAVFNQGRIRSPQFGIHDIMVDGVRASAAAIYKNFSVQTDHYLALDIDQLPPIVDSVGGIPIYIPERTTDLWRPFVIPAGPQILNGVQTAEYSVAFMGSDFGRIHRNEILLEAIRQKLLDPTVWPKIPTLYQQFSSVIVTDFTPEQISHLACLLKNIGTAGVLQDGVRPEWTSPGPRGSLLWNKYYVMNRLTELGFIP